MKMFTMRDVIATVSDLIGFAMESIEYLMDLVSHQRSPLHIHTRASQTKNEDITCQSFIPPDAKALRSWPLGFPGLGSVSRKGLFARQFVCCNGRCCKVSAKASRLREMRLITLDGSTSSVNKRSKFQGPIAAHS